MEIVQLLPVYLLALVEHARLSLFSLHRLYRCSLAYQEASTCTPSKHLHQKMPEGQRGRWLSSYIHVSELECDLKCMADKEQLSSGSLLLPVTALIFISM